MKNEKLPKTAKIFTQKIHLEKKVILIKYILTEVK